MATLGEKDSNRRIDVLFLLFDEHIFFEPTNMATKKPFKLVDLHGQTKKGIMAGSLSEVIKKGKSLFGITGYNVKIALEDGTEIDYDDYMMALDPQTILVIIIDPAEKQKSRPQSSSAEESAVSDVNYNLVEIINRLKQKLYSLVHLRNGSDPATLSKNVHLPGLPLDELACLKDACDQELQRRQKQTDALDLQCLFKKLLTLKGENK